MSDRKSVLGSLAGTVTHTAGAVSSVAATVEALFDGAQMASGAASIHAESFLRKTKLKVMIEEAKEMQELKAEMSALGLEMPEI